MSYQKQPELNGAYYGPPIPPPQSYNRPGRGGGGGCGCCLLDCLCDCGCCLLGCVFKIIFSILVVIGLIILVFWLLVRPHEPKFYATDAAVTTFNFSNTNQLSYDLAVNFTMRNPNRKVGIYYDQIEANAFYSDHRFSTVLGPTFYQGHKNTTSFGPVVFKGQNLVLLGSDEKSDFEKQSRDGLFHIMVRLHLRVRFKLGLFKFGTYKPKVKCDLMVPFKNDGKSSSQKFETTRCRYYF
uniref:Late embryogenesis abundant protein LEA-2 subgroup domain-containing protein n=1 Tax=Opuntia streptacantha TaxID=393608 RepID=A0A7C9E951_OPUST